MNKRVIAAKMKFNMYLLSAALGVIAAVALVLLLVLRYGRAGALLAVVIAVIMAFPVVWYLVRGIRGLRLPKELIVCENGTLTVHTFRGRREIPLREVREMRVATRKGVELLMQPITRDALVFLVNADNPVTSLSQEEAVGIYSGKITNWSEVGGEDRPIVAYQRVEASGSQVMMRAQVMKDVEMVDAPTELRPGEMGELIDRVASYKNTANAIGYSVYYYAHNMYAQDGVRLLAIDGVQPSNETIASGEYPYCQDVYAVIRADEPEDSPARILFNYLQTEECRDLIEAAGYVRLAAQ